MILSTCTDSKYLSSILLTKRFIELVEIIIPSVLIISVAITLFKMVLSPDMKNNKRYLKNIYSKTAGALAIFFVPTMVSALVEATGAPGLSSSTCWQNANTSTIETYKEAEKQRDAGEAAKNKSETEKAKQIRKVVVATRESARAKNEKESDEAKKKALEASEEASWNGTGTASATAAELIRIAESKLGISGTPNEITYAFGSEGGSYSYQWCSEFVWYVSSLSGVYPNKVTKKADSNQIYIQYFKEKGQYQISAGHGGNYVPKMGDYIFFDWSGNPNGGDHIGLVKTVSGNTIYTIEGNSGNAVREKSYSLDNKNVIGYGVWE